MKKWTLRKVVLEKMSAEIIKRAKEKAEAAREHNGIEGEASSSTAVKKRNLNYLPFHPSAWIEICNELDEERKEEYLKLVSEWNKGRVPQEVQQK